MDAQSLEKLIENQPKEIRAKGILIFNAAAQTAMAYQKTPSVANLRDWEAAQAALSKFSEQIGIQESSEKPLPTIADVLEYLKVEGWKVTKTSLYRHQKEGKFIPQPDGAYARRDIDRYARTWLRQQSTGKRIGERLDELQRQKLEKELANLDIENRRKQFSLDKELERYVLPS